MTWHTTCCEEDVAWCVTARSMWRDTMHHRRCERVAPRVTERGGGVDDSVTRRDATRGVSDAP